MRVDYLILADAAAASEGKHYIHGAGWDTIYVGSFPVQHPQLAVAIRLRVAWTETNQPQAIQLDIVDEDGQSVLTDPAGPPSGTINVGRPPHVKPGADQVFPFVMNIRALKFDHPGTFAAILRLNQMEAARAPFDVTPIPGSAAAQP